MRQLRIGVIGLGRIGKLHVEHIQQWLPQFEVAAVADPQLDTQWAQSLNLQKQYQNPFDLIEDNQVEAVLICSPVDSHVPFITAAASKGKHIFCEKPLSLNEQEIQQAIDCVESHQVVCQVGFNRRFDPHFKQLKTAIEKDAIGKLYMIRITSRDPALPPISYLESSGGMMMDMTIHDFDMARYIVGSEVEQVYATGSALVDKAVEACGDVDTAVIQLKFKNGVLGIIDNCRQTNYGYDQRLEVLGEKGGLWADNPLTTSNVRRTQSGQTKEPLQHFFLERYQQSYIDELASFYDSICQQQKPIVDCVDALHAYKLATAAQKSLVQRTPIQI